MQHPACIKVPIQQEPVCSLHLHQLATPLPLFSVGKVSYSKEAGMANAKDSPEGEEQHIRM